MKTRRRKLIRVTQRMINSGERQNGHRCPVAIAISCATAIPVFVDEDEIRERANKKKRFRMPYTVRLFIHNFDRRVPVAPFSFYLQRL